MRKTQRENEHACAMPYRWCLDAPAPGVQHGEAAQVGARSRQLGQHGRCHVGHISQSQLLKLPAPDRHESGPSGSDLCQQATRHDVELALQHMASWMHSVYLARAPARCVVQRRITLQLQRRKDVSWRQLRPSVINAPFDTGLGSTRGRVEFEPKMSANPHAMCCVCNTRASHLSPSPPTLSFRCGAASHMKHRTGFV